MFNEQEWLRLLFLLSDTQTWLDEMTRQAFSALPVSDKKKLLRKSYYLTIPVLAHILEKHYHKIPRYPQVGKFTIPVVEIVHYIREGFSLSANPVPGSLSYQRVVETGRPIGYDKNGTATEAMTILTDGGGKIIAAFPGLLLTDDELPAGNELCIKEDNTANGYSA